MKRIEMQEAAYPYKINLKGPWQYQWLEPLFENVELISEGTARMPASWESIFRNARGSVRFSRSFHRPTNLERHEHVFLVFEGVGGFRELSFNENDITTKSMELSPAKREVEITDLLRPFNKIEIVIEWKGSNRENEQGGLWGPVLLEIRTSERL